MSRVIKANNVDEAVTAVLNLNDLTHQAKQIVLDARKEAARIKSEARAKADDVYRQSSQQGFADGLLRGRSEGLKQGYQEGLSKGQDERAKQLNQAVEMLTAAGKAVHAAREELLGQAKRDMLQFTVELAGKIVGQIARTNDAVVKANLNKVLELAHGGGEMVVHVNPSQLQQMSAFCEELTKVLDVQGSVRLVGDDHVSPGGAILVSRAGLIDATIQTQLDNVVRTLLGADVGAPAVSGSQEGRYVSTQPPRTTSEPARINHMGEA